MKTLSQRKQNVLYAVVKNYIASAEPVGSIQISHKDGLDFSPATVRMVMAELEEQGFLKRSHISSGRIPTAQGFRFYVDKLLKFRKISKKDQLDLTAELKTRIQDPGQRLREACRIISDRTSHPGLALTPKADELNLKHLQFVSIRETLALAILVSSTGLVQNKIIHLDHPMNQAELNRLHNYINDRWAGRPVHEIRQKILLEMKTTQSQYDQLLNNAILMGEQVFADSETEMHVAGEAHLLHEPEFADVGMMQNLLRLLGEKTRLVQILDQCLRSPGVRIFMGEELEFPEVNGLTFITSVYSDAEGHRGVLGVVGPTRMDYAKLVPLVDFTSQLLTDTLQDNRK